MEGTIFGGKFPVSDYLVDDSQLRSLPLSLFTEQNSRSKNRNVYAIYTRRPISSKTSSQDRQFVWLERYELSKHTNSRIMFLLELKEDVQVGDWIHTGMRGRDKIIIWCYSVAKYNINLSELISRVARFCKIVASEPELRRGRGSSEAFFFGERKWGYHLLFNRFQLAIIHPVNRVRYPLWSFSLSIRVDDVERNGRMDLEKISYPSKKK